jgi:hypothetical protein
VQQVPLRPLIQCNDAPGGAHHPDEKIGGIAGLHPQALIQTEIVHIMQQHLGLHQEQAVPANIYNKQTP